MLAGEVCANRAPDLGGQRPVALGRELLELPTDGTGDLCGDYGARLVRSYSHNEIL
jgi:hypothetical protein